MGPKGAGRSNELPTGERPSRWRREGGSAPTRSDHPRRTTAEPCGFVHGEGHGALRPVNRSEHERASSAEL